MVTDVFTNSAEITLFGGEHVELSFLAYGLSELWREVGFIENGMDWFHVAWWYSHLLDFLVFLCYLPYSKHSHVLTIVPNVYSVSQEPTGVLQPIKDFEKAESFGVGKAGAVHLEAAAGLQHDAARVPPAGRPLRIHPPLGVAGAAHPRREATDISKKGLAPS